MRLAIASDHAGWRLKDELKARLEAAGHTVIDLGGDAERCDYPLRGEAVGRAVASGEVELGVITCGSGLGVAIAANKVPGVRAATVHEPLSAELLRTHNHGNVICFGERLIGPELAWVSLQAFLAATPMGDRHAVRVGQIQALDGLRPPQA